MDSGHSVILELGLIRRRDRDRAYNLIDAAGYAYTIYVLDAAKEVRRERITQRNEERGTTFSMEVPDAIFELASDMWEALDEDECAKLLTRHTNRSP